MATFAERFKEALEQREKTQSDICRLTGIGKSAISQYLKGNFVPKQQRVYAIAKALNVSESWLMGYDVPPEPQKEPQKEQKNHSLEFVPVEYNPLDDTQKSTTPAETDKDDANKQKLMNNYDVLNNEGQQDLVDYSDMLAGNPRKLKESDKAVPVDA